MSSKFKGTGVAIVTPFKKDFSVDLDALSQLVNHLIDGKVEYLVVLGTTGESVTLSKKEKELVTKQVVKTTAQRIPLVLGVGGNNTSEIVNELKTTDFTGIDAILSVSPSYSKPNQEGIYQHFKALAEVSPLPIILYNVPSRTGSNMSAETTLRLANDFQNIVAIKEASGNMEQCMRIAAAKPKNFLLISGDDNLAIPITSIGGKGVISVLANAFPYETSEAIRAALKHDFEKACGYYLPLLEITDAIFADGNPAGIKAVLKMMNITQDGVRLPLVQINSALEQKLQLLVDKRRMVNAD